MRRTLSIVCLILSGVAAEAGPVSATLQVFENQRFVPSDQDFGDSYGAAIAVEGNTAFITATVGDTNGNNSGSAYIYERPGGVGSWIQTGEISPSDGVTLDYFGASADVDGDLAVFGAPGDGTNGVRSGAAYVFRRQPSGMWTQAAKLLPTGGHSTDSFGASVAISGHQIIVGAPGNIGATSDTGTAYVFNQNASGNWDQTAKLGASNATSDAGFGFSVDLAGDRAVVGAPNHGAGSIHPGGAYVFDKQPDGTWTETSRLAATAPNDLAQFGYSVSIDGGEIAVGAPKTLRGVNYDGAVEIFGLGSLGTWDPLQSIRSDYVATGGGAFGSNVAVTGDYLVVGAESQYVVADSSGAAYVYVKGVGGEWTPSRVLVGSDVDIEGRFGRSVAVDGSNAFVGAYAVKFNSGAAYYYDLAVPEPSSALLAVAGLAAVVCGRWGSHRGWERSDANQRSFQRGTDTCR